MYKFNTVIYETEKDYQANHDNLICMNHKGYLLNKTTSTIRGHKSRYLSLIAKNWPHRWELAQQQAKLPSLWDLDAPLAKETTPSSFCTSPKLPCHPSVYIRKVLRGSTPSWAFPWKMQSSSASWQLRHLQLLFHSRGFPQLFLFHIYIT